MEATRGRKDGVGFLGVMGGEEGSDVARYACTLAGRVHLLENSHILNWLHFFVT